MFDDLVTQLQDKETGHREADLILIEALERLIDVVNNADYSTKQDVDDLQALIKAYQEIPRFFS